MNMNINPDFDITTYRNNNIDLMVLSDNELMHHFINHGYKEHRIWHKQYNKMTNNMYEFNIIYPNFNINAYIKHNVDLKNKSIKELMIHYHTFGKYEGRICTDTTDDTQLQFICNEQQKQQKQQNQQNQQKQQSVPFYYNLYLKEIDDGNLYTLSKSYEHYETSINEQYKNNMEFMIALNITPNNYYYFYKLHEFINIYFKKSSNKYVDIYNQLLSDTKLEFRYFCFRYIDYMRTLPVKEIKLHQINETVLIEMRPFPHIEFTLRNMISKTSDNWSHTVICGNLNYTCVKQICSSISNNIRIIQVNHDNLDPSSYSQLLTSEYFWNNLVGEKILIYQEDSCIFNSNIDDFLQYDYIGAPWPIGQDDNANLVGNGGFSLRSKSVMLKVLDTVSLNDTQYNFSTLQYIINSKSTTPPEDVYFSKNIIDYNLGIVASHDVAQQFSVETIYNDNPLGGHNFYLSIKKWKEHMYKHVVKQAYANINFKSLEHRCGWGWILSHLIKNDIVIQYNDNDFDYDLSQKMLYLDMIEKHFMWDKLGYISIPWMGVIHCTNITPEYLKLINTDLLFNDEIFIESLKNCKCIIVLSTYLENYVVAKLNALNIIVPVKMIKYSCFDDNVVMFNWDNFINNNNKKIIQLGQQLRIITSIYVINTTFEKLWLPGTKNNQHLNFIFSNECKLFNHIITEDEFNSVKTKYLDDYNEFDELLSLNIVFINLFDASANTTVIECIVRNTPIIVNRIEAIEEYLGSDYPLYFNDISEVPLLLTNYDKLYDAHIYLKNMVKSDLKINKFVEFTSNLINNC